MQTVSQNYKNDIKKKLRNHSYMRVTVGVINQQAQRSAQVDDQSNYLYFSNFRKPFNSYVAESLPLRERGLKYFVHIKFSILVIRRSPCGSVD